MKAHTFFSNLIDVHNGNKFYSAFTTSDGENVEIGDCVMYNDDDVTSILRVETIYKIEKDIEKKILVNGYQFISREGVEEEYDYAELVLTDSFIEIDANNVAYPVDVLYVPMTEKNINEYIQEQSDHGNSATCIKTAIRVTDEDDDDKSVQFIDDDEDEDDNSSVDSNTTLTEEDEEDEENEDDEDEEENNVDDKYCEKDDDEDNESVHSDIDLRSLSSTPKRKRKVLYELSSENIIQDGVKRKRSNLINEEKEYVRETYFYRFYEYMDQASDSCKMVKAIPYTFEEAYREINPKIMFSTSVGGHIETDFGEMLIYDYLIPSLMKEDLSKSVAESTALKIVNNQQVRESIRNGLTIKKWKYVCSKVNPETNAYRVYQLLRCFKK